MPHGNTERNRRETSRPTFNTQNTFEETKGNRGKFYQQTLQVKYSPWTMGIIKVVKQKYRKKIVQRYLREIEKGTKKDTFKINVVDALHYITPAWDDVKQETIQNCFGKAGFCTPTKRDDLEINEEEDGDLSELEKYPHYVCVDDDLVTSEPWDLEQIMRVMSAHLFSSDEGGGESDYERTRLQPTCLIDKRL